MLRRIISCNLKFKNILVCYNSTVNESISSKIQNTAGITVISDIPEEPSNFTKSVLEPLDEDISHVSSYLKPTFNFAAYVNKSETLQELLKLGVNFHQIEQNPNTEVVPFMLGLKFKDIKGHLIFLKELGLTNEDIGFIITKSPLLLKEDLENLQIRINYLKHKKFTGEMISWMVKSSSLLTYSTQEIDERLGFIQNSFNLTGDEVRAVVVKSPRLITTRTNKIKMNIFCLKEEMGFHEEELKKILLCKPLIYTKGEKRLLQTFEYIHRDMNISLERIAEQPEILTCRKKRLMERHLFLDKLGRAQYNPKKPNYVSLTTLVSGSDAEFSTEVAKSSIQAYNEFLKSL